MHYRIEICANSAESAANAQRGGAYRVELCAGMSEGGTTPSYGEITAARRLLDATRLNVIIRPRGGDFMYSPLELDIMEQDISAARTAGADGIVLGCLDADGHVDMSAMQRLMTAARGMSVTFHRAFDMCADPFGALEQIVSLGCDRILTSGQSPTAAEGTALLRELVSRAGGRISIMPGCGITPQNIASIARDSGATEFHLSARTAVPSGMRFRNARVSMGGVVKIDEYSRSITGTDTVRAALEELQALERQGRGAAS